MTNQTNDLAIIILAAGKGQRMKSDMPKVMHKLAGLPMINWLIKSCEALNPAKIIPVIAPDMDDVREAVHPHECAVQQSQNGTGDAAKAALDVLGDFQGRVLILMGDEPFVPVNALQALASGDEINVLAFETATPDGLGRVIAGDDGTLKEIIEDRDATDAQKQINLCNSGNIALSAQHLEKWLNALETDNAQGEFYLTDVPKIAAKDGVKTHIKTIGWLGPWGINDKAQLAVHEGIIQKSLRLSALQNGVTMLDPDSVYFSFDTRIDEGVTLEPNIFFGPGVSVGKNVTIKAFSHIEGASIKDGASVGPFARIRPGSEIGENAKVGNFAEINRSNIGDGSKVSHHSYVGDCDMGAGVNYSAGAITANYDGFDKGKTIIGDNAMIGTNVNLVAPVTIGADAYVAAGSTVTKDVEDGALALERAEIKTKKGWVARFRAVKDKRK